MKVYSDKDSAWSPEAVQRASVEKRKSYLKTELSNFSYKLLDHFKAVCWGAFVTTGVAVWAAVRTDIDRSSCQPLPLLSTLSHHCRSPLMPLTLPELGIQRELDVDSRNTPFPTASNDYSCFHCRKTSGDLCSADFAPQLSSPSRATDTQGGGYRLSIGASYLHSPEANCFNFVCTEIFAGSHFKK